MIFPNQPQTTGHVARHYDDLDAFYREIWGDHVHHGLWVTGRESMQEALEALVDRVAREGRVPSLGSSREYTAMMEEAGIRAVLRMIVAFRTGAFRYGILVGEKSSGATSGDDVWPRGAPAASGA